MAEKKVHPFDRAWAAGLFEAKDPLRGHRTGVKKGNTIRIDSANTAILNRFLSIVGVGKMSTRQKENVTRPYGRYETTSMDDSRTLLLFLAPFFTTSQLVKVSEMVSRIERNDHWQKNNPDKAANPVAHKLESKIKDKE